MSGISQRTLAQLPGCNLLLDCYEFPETIDLDDRPENPKLEIREDDIRIRDQARNWCMLALTKLERRMIDIMNRLTDKPGWAEKVKNPEIRAHWEEDAKKIWADVDAQAQLQDPLVDRDEVRQKLLLAFLEDPERCLESGDDEEWQTTLDNGPPGPPITEETMRFCWEEMQYKAERLKVHGCITVIGLHDADIVKSDLVVPDSFRTDFSMLIRQLENDPFHLVDWHPGQENIVRNLLHPSLYALEFGRTTVLTSETIPLASALSYTGCGVTLPLQNAPSGYSNQFQWLPTELRFSPNGNEVEFVSYINNLEYPRHKDLYKALEKLVNYSIPLWELCMATRMRKFTRRNEVTDEEMTWSPPEGEAPETPPDYYWYQGMFRHKSESASWREDWEEAWQLEYRKQAWPEPSSFQHWVSAQSNEKQIDLRSRYAKSGLQVIVKIASIQLSPENPRYDGGKWHVEGLANEHICATAVYYYENENITESRLQFRCATDLPIEDYEAGQDDFYGLERIYDAELGHGVDSTQNIASVATSQGRLLAFANVFQHCVEPFELADPERPGHRRIVVLWLVNPDARILSTAHVPPQQRERYERFVSAAMHARGTPPELTRMIATANTRHLATEAEAKAVRETLLRERSVGDNDMIQHHFQFNFCEH